MLVLFETYSYHRTISSNIYIQVVPNLFGHDTRCQLWCYTTVPSEPEEQLMCKFANLLFMYLFIVNSY